MIFDSRSADCKQPFGAVKAGEEVVFTVFIPKNEQISSVSLLVYKIDDWESGISIPMLIVGSDIIANSYRCSFSPTEVSLYSYFFEIRDNNSARQIKKGLGSGGVIGDGGRWQLTVYDQGVKTPAALNGVIYQIFPDRFFHSNTPKTAVPTDRILRSDWGELPYWKADERGIVTNSDYFCGDLEGINQKLSYLEWLGVSVIYLNPIFEAHSNHRYDTADYMKIDPLLGGEEDFKALCANAKKRGITIVIDGVFNHTGSDSVYFNKQGRYGEKGAYNDTESPYYPWYNFKSYPSEYDCWWGFPTLPNINESEESFIEFICGEDGVIRHWMRLGAGGFRLDVVDELPDIFLDALYKTVKEENPEGIVIGEVWEDASNKISYGKRRRYLLGGQLDSVMNYPFKDAILRYIRFGGGGALLESIMQLVENYPPEIISALMNPLSTHDTQRAITALCADPCDGQDRQWQYNNNNLSREQYDKGRELFLLASIIQFGVPGVPSVYYGDEAGVYGYKDPFNRACYPWGKEDEYIIENIRALGWIRRDYPIFDKGEFVPITFGDDVCAFERRCGDTSLYFAVNRSEQSHRLVFVRQDLPKIVFAVGGYDSQILAPYSGVILYWK